ncbi:hypothetical protein DMUE_3153 [Dictyocoela muelleri]|nr:hypothetical protein DMUE_3153 [Dictyocoela muelleri]
MNYFEMMKNVRRVYGDNIMNIPTMPLHTYIFTGQTGTGKTLFTCIFNKILEIGRYNLKSNFFFDGISLIDKLIHIDGFMSNDFNIQKLNRLIDNNDNMKNAKHSKIRSIPEFLIISTNENISDMFKKKPIMIRDSFLRRIDVIIEFIKKDKNLNEMKIKLFSFNKDINKIPKRIITYNYCLSSGKIQSELHKYAYKFINIVLDAYIESAIDKNVTKNFCSKYKLQLGKYSKKLLNNLN